LCCAERGNEKESEQERGGSFHTCTINSACVCAGGVCREGHLRASPEDERGVAVLRKRAGCSRAQLSCKKAIRHGAQLCCAPAVRVDKVEVCTR
jgi:hypothetical protein